MSKRGLLVEVLIVLRLITNEGTFLENRRPVPRTQPPEVARFIRRPARRGQKIKKINQFKD